MAEIEKSCENCYYSQPSVREDLVYCKYIGDVIGDGTDVKLDKHVVESLRFQGFVYEAYVDRGGDEPSLEPCVTLKSKCRKFVAKS